MHPSQFVSSPEGYLHKMSLGLCSRHGNRACLESLWGYFLRNKSCVQADLPTEKTMPQHPPLYTEAEQAQLPAQNSEHWRSLEQPSLRGPWEKKVFREKKAKKTNTVSGNCKVRSGQVLFTWGMLYSPRRKKKKTKSRKKNLYIKLEP